MLNNDSKSMCKTESFMSCGPGSGSLGRAVPDASESRHRNTNDEHKQHDMNVSDEVLDRAERLLPTPRGKLRVRNRQVLLALLHVRATGCKWPQLPEAFGPWHTIYTRVRRWSNSGVLPPVLQVLDQTPAAAPQASAGQPDRADPTALAALADEMRPLIFMLYKHLKEERHNYRLSQQDVAVMMAIERGAGTSVRALAQLLEVPSQTMSVALRRLSSQGWIESAERRPTADARSVSVTITRAGRRILAEVRAGRSDQLVRQFSRFDAPSIDALRRALPVLGKLAGGLIKALPVERTAVLSARPSTAALPRSRRTPARRGFESAPK